MTDAVGIAIDHLDSTIYVTSHLDSLLVIVFQNNTVTTVTTPNSAWGGVIVTSSPSVTSSASSEGGLTSKEVILISTVSVIAFVMITFLSIVVIVLIRRRKKTPVMTEVEMIQTPKPTPKEEEKDVKIPMTLNHVDIRRLLEKTKDGIHVYIGDWNGTPVILKKMLNENAFKILAKEVVAFSKIKHPNCVLFLGTYCDDGGRKYIVTEYIARDLRQLLTEDRDKLTQVELVSIAIGIARGLAYLEEQKIVHRDVALRNILVSERDDKYTAKVSEYGMSRSGDMSVYSTESSHISVKWRAVEILKGNPHTQKSDMWSFGVLLYEIFSYGKEPYHWLSDKDAYVAILRGERLPKPEGCHEKVYELMLSCWNEDPEKRPSFVQLIEKLRTLKMVLKGISVNVARHEDEYEEIPRSSVMITSASENFGGSSSTPYETMAE